jgi:hypothetical protein
MRKHELPALVDKSTTRAVARKIAAVCSFTTYSMPLSNTSIPILASAGWTVRVGI